MRAVAQTAKNVIPQINVTPLIDILLVLLIIFMVITPLRPARFKTLVPQKVRDMHHETRMSPRTLVVEVRPDMSLALIRGRETVAEGSVAEPEAVSARLAREWQERKARGEWQEEMATRADLAPDERIERTVFVKAPRSIHYGQVARIIDQVKGAGAQPIGLQTEALPD